MGKPLFTTLHPVRQRRVMRRLLCQVCAGPADRTQDGELWLVPETAIDGSADWPEGMSTIHPPLCRPCARISIRMCPALRPRFVAIRARSRVCGVTGVRFGPGHLYPRLLDDDDEITHFDNPAIRWVQATLLARSLHECILVDLEPLS